MAVNDLERAAELVREARLLVLRSRPALLERELPAGLQGNYHLNDLLHAAEFVIKTAVAEDREDKVHG